nr:uncharacterized protein LOC117680403 isoform X3 [Crassostrea gigas]
MGRPSHQNASNKRQKRQNLPSRPYKFPAWLQNRNCPCCPNHKALWNIDSEDYTHTFSVYPRCPYKFPAWLQNSNCPACRPNHKAWWNIDSEEDTHTFSVYPR